MKICSLIHRASLLSYWHDSSPCAFRRHFSLVFSIDACAPIRNSPSLRARIAPCQTASSPPLLACLINSPTRCTSAAMLPTLIHDYVDWTLRFLFFRNKRHPLSASGSRPIRIAVFLQPVRIHQTRHFVIRCIEKGSKKGCLKVHTGSPQPEEFRDLRKRVAALFGNFSIKSACQQA